MISANALVYEAQKSYKMLEKSPFESPYIVQLSGEKPEAVRRAVEILNDIEGIDGIDLNCGCPVPKVVKQGAGAALLLEPKRLCEIVETVKKTSNKRYTSVKMRLGFTQKDAFKFAFDIENAGADYICVHGRTRAEGYSGVADYEAVARVKASVKIPVIANGDIDEGNFLHVLEITGADGVMIGRGAVGKPWVFAELKGVAVADKAGVVAEHLAMMGEVYGERATGLFRKHLHEYSKGLVGASEFRQKVNFENDFEAMRRLVEDFFRDKF